MGEILSDKAEQFRSNVAQCDRKAEQAKNAEAKQQFRQAAENWRNELPNLEHNCF
jgi:hypothetical protein